ncbi:hypothetical protein [Vulcanisaeta distributa]|uniref:hypothetical protein n=1 Tax=Vulcanisaeta distributa TaxID=164451 RepID=UPI000B2E69CF|nr:hypothetical protein [Vulcanisaeta distributa]
MLIASLAFFSVVLVRFSIPSLLPYLIGLNGINTVMGGFNSLIALGGLHDFPGNRWFNGR